MRPEFLARIDRQRTRTPFVCRMKEGKVREGPVLANHLDQLRREGISPAPVKVRFSSAARTALLGEGANARWEKENLELLKPQ